MSDLISRKKINDYIKGEINPYGKPFEGTAYELGLKIMRYIDAMDSAYSVEKIVEKLEERKHEICLSDDDLEYYQNGIDEAIEIVKHGGVSDDVCEWKDGAIGIFNIKTSCGNSIDVNYGYEFCPYCGKKIKIVGD